MKTVIQFWVLAVVMIMTGCAIFDSYQTKGAEQIAAGIAHYCDDTTEDIREGLRAEVNALAAPNTIVITCGE